MVLLTKDLSPASPDSGSFAAFQRDKLANNWRSATFQCISVALRAGNDRGRVPSTPVAKLCADNVKQTIDRITQVLSEVSSLSGGRVAGVVEEDITRTANIALEIALQFGIHPAQLRLLVPNRDEQVMIGEDFHDCENGDGDKGITFPVDLVIMPALQKIGDGRADTSSKRTIVPCEIYPA